MDNRQKQLLKVIVETYVKSVKPVGSKSLCEKFNLSSATIRNEMAILEDLGYIEKNHISSGRIPSEKGYRYYVENLMEPEKLNGSEMLKLQRVVKNQDLVLSDAITKCMEIISDLTNYASIVLGSSSMDNLLKQVSIIPIDENKIVALVCTNTGLVENKKFVLPEGTNVKELIKTSEIINKMLIGTPIKDVSERLEFEIKPIIAQEISNYEKEVLQSIPSDSLYPDAEDIVYRSNEKYKGTLLKYVPLTVIVLVLFLISITGIVTIKTVRSIRYFGIMYICGMNYTKAQFMTILEMTFNSVLAFAFTTNLLALQKQFKLVGKINCNIGMLQMLFMLSVCIIIVLWSGQTTKNVLKGNTPIEIIKNME